MRTVVKKKKNTLILEHFDFRIRKLRQDIIRDHQLIRECFALDQSFKYQFLYSDALVIEMNNKLSRVLQRNP